MIDVPKDLTPEQKAAMENYFNDPKNLFLGSSPQWVIDVFRDVNEARKKNDTERADQREKEWFKILGRQQNKKT